MDFIVLPDTLKQYFRVTVLTIRLVSPGVARVKDDQNIALKNCLRAAQTKRSYPRNIVFTVI